MTFNQVYLIIFFVLLEFSVEWIYAALIGDYIVKAIMLVNRFRSAKWQQVFSAKETRLDPIVA